MTNAEFIAQHPKALELLDWIACNPAREVTEGGMIAFEARILRGMAVQGLVRCTTRTPSFGLVTAYYRLTADGWLALRREEP